MKKYLLVLLIIATIFKSQAQINVDSLWNIWNNTTVADSLRIDALNEMAWSGFLFSQPDSAFACAQLAYELAEKLALKDRMAVSLNTQGASYWVRGIHSKALLYFKKSLELFL